MFYSPGSAMLLQGGKLSVLAAARDERVRAVCLLDPVDNTGGLSLPLPWDMHACTVRYSRLSRPANNSWHLHVIPVPLPAVRSPEKM